MPTPGVGDYDITNLVGLDKAKETTFEMPKYYPVGAFSDKRILTKARTRAQSAHPGRKGRDLSENGRSPGKSRSPRAHVTTGPMALGVGTAKRLGGPTTTTNNFMMQASRSKRGKVFDKERFYKSSTANLNTLGPGPAC